MLLYNGKILRDGEGSWVKLSTRRKSKQPDIDSYYIKGYKYFGSKEELEELKRQNPIILENKQIFPIGLDEITDLFSNCTIDSSCRRSTMEDIVLDDKLIDQPLSNLITTARLLRVIDGDTFDVAIEIPLFMIKGVIFSFDIYPEQAVIIKIRTRLYGIDTAELNTEEGRLMKEYMENNIPSFFYIHLIHKDKYGRFLSLFFKDREMKEKILPTKYKLYLGGTK